MGPQSDTTEQLTHTVSLHLWGLKGTQQTLIQSQFLLWTYYVPGTVGYQGYMKSLSLPSRSILCRKKMVSPTLWRKL